MHGGLVNLPLCLIGLAAFAGEPGAGDSLRSCAEAIEGSCWPGEVWSDVAVLLWLMDQPGDSGSVSIDRLASLGGAWGRGNIPETGQGQGRIDPPGLRPGASDPRMPAGPASVRAYREWTEAGKAQTVTSSASVCVRPLQWLLAEGRWMEQRTPEGMSRSLSGGVEAHDLGIIAIALVGDYRFDVAQGLLFGRGPAVAGSFSRSPPADRIGLSIPGFSRGYSGVILRFSDTAGLPDLTLCLSRSRPDRSRITPAVVQSEESSADGEVRADVVAGGTELLYGARVRWAPIPALCVGAGFVRCGVDPDRPGRPVIRAQVAGLDASVGTDGLTLSMELCRQSPGILAAGARGDLIITSGLRIAAGGRSFGAGYWNPHSSDIDEDGDARSEKSFWAETTVDLLPWLSIDGLATRIRKLSYASACPIPLATTRSAARTEILPFSGVRLVIACSATGRERLSAGLDELGRVVKVVREWRERTLRIDLGANLARRFECSLRFAGTEISNPLTGRDESGLLLAAAGSWTPFQLLRVDMRWTIFGTDSYDSRLYSGEQVVPGRARFVMLYGEGVRTGVWIRVSPERRVRITFAATRTVRSGPADPYGMRRTEYVVQLDARI